MKAALQNLLTPTGQLVTIVVLAGALTLGVAWFKPRRAPETPPAAPPPSLPQVFQRLATRPEPAPASAPTEPTPEPTAPAAAAPRILPLSVAAATPTTTAAPLAPFGRLIPCETTVTLESSRIDTPVIGLVTEDVWHNGRLLIPAGAEVHGRASLDRVRERLSAEGIWRLVWTPAKAAAALELRVQALALERAYDPATGTWGEHDGSAGLRGQLIRTDDLRELRLFAAAFLSAATGALQETRSFAGPLGEVSVPEATARNGALAGSAAVLREYAETLREAIRRDGVFLRIPAGKPFTLYVTEAFPSAPPTSAAPVPAPATPVSP